MHHYPHHVGDFRAGTVNMTRLERWLYRDMLDCYYDTEQPLPLDIAKLCRELGARTEDEKAAVAEILDYKFEKTKAGYVHSRCEEEIAIYRAKAATAKENGSKGGRPPKKKAGDAANPPAPEPEAEDNQKKPSGFQSGLNPDAICSQPETGSKTNQEPVTNNHKPAYTPLPALSGGDDDAVASADDAAPQAAAESESSNDAQGSLLPAEPTAAGNVAAAKPTSPDADFETAWGFYPKRDGGSNKQAALKAWRARVAQGKSVDAMIAGVMRYAKYCEAKGNTGSQYVKRAETFFGPDLHFEQEWAITSQTSAPARAEKFDPLAYINRNRTDAANEQDRDYIDV